MDLFHCGPYIECIARAITTKMIYFCASGGEDGGHDISFTEYCRTCGGDIKSKWVPTLKAAIDSERLDREVGDRIMNILSEDVTCYYVSNITDNDISKTSLVARRPGQFGEIRPWFSKEVCEFQVGAEKFRFTNFFKKEIEILQRHFKEVRVCWGVLSCY